MKQLLLKIAIVATLILCSFVARSQSIVGCWEAEQFITASDTVEFPDGMIQYVFEPEKQGKNVYLMRISGKEKKIQRGTYVYSMERIFLYSGDARIATTNDAAEIQSGMLIWTVTLDDQEGKMSFSQLECQ